MSSKKNKPSLTVERTHAHTHTETVSIGEDLTIQKAKKHATTRTMEE